MGRSWTFTRRTSCVSSITGTLSFHMPCVVALCVRSSLRLLWCVRDHNTPCLSWHDRMHTGAAGRGWTCTTTGGASAGRPATAASAAARASSGGWATRCTRACPRARAPAAPPLALAAPRPSPPLTCVSSMRCCVSNRSIQMFIIAHLDDDCPPSLSPVLY